MRASAITKLTDGVPAVKAMLRTSLTEWSIIETAEAIRRVPSLYHAHVARHCKAAYCFGTELFKSSVP